MSAVRRLSFAAACALVAVALSGATAHADTAFPNGFWSQPLAPDAAIDPSTPAVAANIAAQVAKGAGFNVRQWTGRIYQVPADQPMVRVIVDGTSNPDQLLQAALNADGGVPFPAGAEPSSYPAGPQPDTDSEIVVYQPDWTDGSGLGTGREWEFWHASSPLQNAPGAGPLPWGAPSHGDSQWHVGWGGRLSYSSTSPGYPVDRHTQGSTLAARVATAALDPTYESRGWLATATSLPLLGGEITFDDWNRGVIDHAVGVSLRKDSLRPGFVWPAQRGDGKVTTALIQEGTRLRLPAGYPIDPTAPKLIRMLEQAAKTYGFVVWDGAGNVTMRMELQQTGNPQGACPAVSTCTNAWLQPGGAFYDNAGKFVYPVQMAKLFPWGALQVLTPRTS